MGSMDAQAASERERISHVVRRLGYGARPDVVAALPDVDAAIGEALHLSSPPVDPGPLRVESANESRSRTTIRSVDQRWLEATLPGRRPIEQRLTWFWHDHFAIDLRKVGFAHLVDGYHQTIRRLATESFAELLNAVAIDPAMLM